MINTLKAIFLLIAVCYSYLPSDRIIHSTVSTGPIHGWWKLKADLKA
jgi:hypothetical protein